ncbi:peptide chain release factor-like protein [Cardiobacterium valvarum]|uniref:peptide chain release factor-like protein n=1 Tax=Cardiobacterium valvarum TaxID=194702 RepID=UPI00209E9133|nr:peptide chain release factor-like protein [Cardiobacterium valvarum]
MLIQSCKAGGKGGQHVNKTRSAVWATDSVSGLRVKVQAERSQHANRRLACQQLDARHAALAAEREAVQRHAQHCCHFQIERGNPVRIFVGDDFHERA